MTANQDGWDPLPLPTDRPILARTVDGEEIPVQHEDSDIFFHVYGEWEGFWHKSYFTGWRELKGEDLDAIR